MSFSQTAATSVVPTLARLVLAFAFVTIGVNKFQETTFDAASATTLRDLGVTVTPVTPVEAEAASDEAGTAAAPASRSVRLASLQDEPAADPPADAGADPATDSAADPAADDVAIPAEPLPDGEYTARALHRITLLCYGAGWTHDSVSLPVILAWMAALTELVGGAMLLLGLLSRIWALGLAGAMGVAFYLVSMGKYGVHTQSPFEFAQNIGHYNTVCAQLGLGVLAFGIVLTGAGPLSLDRVLFGRGRAKPEIDDLDAAPAAAPPPPAPVAPVPTPAAPAPPAPDVPIAEAPAPPTRDDEPMPPPSEGGRPL